MGVFREEPAEAGSIARRATILVVDDDLAFHETVARYLSRYRRLRAFNEPQAMDALARHHVDVILLSLNLGEISGVDLLRRIRADRDDVEVIVVTGRSDTCDAIACFDAGAFDFLAKSYENYQQIDEHVLRALEHRRTRRGRINTRIEESERNLPAQVEGTTAPTMLQVVEALHRAAETRAPVVLEGERGVGKITLARYLHGLGAHAANSFVRVNAASVPASQIERIVFGRESRLGSGVRHELGLMEHVDTGTLVIENLDALVPPAQERLVRAVRSGAVERLNAVETSPHEARIVATSVHGIDGELLERLGAMRIAVPPLRERASDIPRLLGLAAAASARETGRRASSFTDEALATLAAHAWPGNVRELENLAARLVASGVSRVRMVDLPPEYCADRLAEVASQETMTRSVLAMARAHFERFLVDRTVARCGGNIVEAARHLGLAPGVVRSALDAPERTFEATSLHGDEP